MRKALEVLDSLKASLIADQEVTKKAAEFVCKRYADVPQDELGEYGDLAYSAGVAAGEANQIRKIIAELEMIESFGSGPRATHLKLVQS